MHRIEIHYSSFKQMLLYKRFLVTICAIGHNTTIKRTCIMHNLKNFKKSITHTHTPNTKHIQHSLNDDWSAFKIQHISF